MSEQTTVITLILLVIILDWAVYDGRFEMWMLHSAIDMASNATSDVEEFISRNLRRG